MKDKYKIVKIVIWMIAGACIFLSAVIIGLMAANGKMVIYL